MRRVGGVGGGAAEPPGGLNVGQRAGAEHTGVGFRVPGQRGVHIVKQSFAHHKRFAGTAFFTRTAVETNRPTTAVLRQPAPAGNGGGQRRGAQQIVTTAVAVRP